MPARGDWNNARIHAAAQEVFSPPPALRPPSPPPCPPFFLAPPATRTTAASVRSDQEVPSPSPTSLALPPPFPPHTPVPLPPTYPSLKGGPKPRVRKFGRKTISVIPTICFPTKHSTHTGANVKISHTGVELGSGGVGGGRPIGPRRLG